MSINPDAFNKDSLLTKALTNREFDGTSIGDNPQTYAASPIPTYQVSVKEGAAHASDVTKVFTGPGAGIAAGLGGPTDTVGHVTATGNRMTITGTAGAETIELVHHSGAVIQIDADGSIFLIPSSRRGYGLHSPKGDGVVSAQGRLIIKGSSSITLETEGSMEFNVGKNLFMDVGGDYLLNVRGATTLSSDGTLTTEASKDKIDIIGGIERRTIAGDQRTQVAGDIRQDAGKNILSRAKLNIESDSEQNIIMRSKEASTFSSSEGNINIAAKEDVYVSAKENVRLVAQDDVTFDAKKNIALKSDQNIINSAGQKHFIDAAQSVEAISGEEYRVQAGNDFKVQSRGLNISAQGSGSIQTSGAMDIRGSTVDVNKGGASVNAPGTPEITTARDTPPLEAPKAAEFPDANTVIDHMTSEREAPDFPYNSKKMSAEEMSRYENEGDTPNPKAKSQAEGNQGAGSPYQKGSGAGTISDSASYAYDGSGNQSRAEENSYPSPTSLLNSSEKLSRNVTIGMFGNLHLCPAEQMGLSRQQILDNARHLSFNILDPVLEHFGSRVLLLPAGAGLRVGQGGSRHYLGKAHDLRAASHDAAETAMIAKWIVENLPFDRLFLEANNYGSIHIHVEAAPPGSSGARTVWTCEDPKCNGRVDGLQLAYAQQGLKKMGFA